jgi:hypothetical protein
MHEQSIEITRVWLLVDWLDRLQTPRGLFEGTKARVVDWLDARLFPVG